MIKQSLLILSLAALVSCNASTDSELSSSEINHISTTLQDYRQAWLDNDTAKVMGAMSDEVILFIPGNTSKNISGKSAVKDFWFPPSDTRYPIRVYEISDEQIFGSGLYATAQGRSLLSWDTMKGDSLTATDTSKSDYLTILRKEEAGWKIYRQMFQTRD